MSTRELPSGTEDIDEAGSLAMELANAYQQMTAFYHEQMQLSGPGADLSARGLDLSPQDSADDTARIQACPSDQVTWADLNRLVNHDPENMAAVWKRMKDEAVEELASGHRAAQTLDWQRRPWARAQFLSIRESFRAETPPQNGIEAALIDIAAEAFGDYLELSGQLHIQMSAEADVEHNDLEREGRWHPPHSVIADSIERSSRMAERAHNRFLKTIKMLHEMRRSSSTLYVANAAQVNLGQQQVNVVESDTEVGPAGKDFPK